MAIAVETGDRRRFGATDLYAVRFVVPGKRLPFRRGRKGTPSGMGAQAAVG